MFVLVIMFYIFNILAQNIDCGYTLERVPTIYVLVQKIGAPLQTPVLLYIKLRY